ncbi:TPA: ABC transporter permease, partial [bacterium]|nr:ABC transporter permease [bacterium]
MKKILSVSKKEFIEIIRDPRTLAMVLTLPTIMLFIYSYAINLDLRLIKTVIYDLDESKQSRDLIGKFLNSGYFKIIKYIDRYDDIDRYLDSGKARVAICIPSDFSRKLIGGKSTDIQTIVDGSDASTS